VVPESPSDEGRRYERVFVLRVWEESGDLTCDGMRGSIHDLENGRKFFFSGLRDLQDFLVLRLAPDSGTAT
jgi:hypothetical protein